MTIKDLEELLDYGYWANRKMFGAIAQLTPDEFTRPVAGSYGSIRNTMVHALSAEWGWLDRCGGARRGPKLNPDDYPSPAAVIDLWTRVEQHMREFLSTLDDRDVDRIVEFSIFGSEKQSMALGQLLQHAAVHGVHHRGQVSLLLRELGHPAGDFDILFYHAAKRVPA